MEFSNFYKGTIDLVTYTARGVGTVPGVIYKDVFRIKKKTPEASAKEKIAEKQNMALIYEDEKEQVYVDKKRLSIQGLKAAQNPVLVEANASDALPLDYKVSRIILKK